MVANAFGLQPDNRPIFLCIDKEYDEEQGAEEEGEERTLWVEDGGQIDVHTILSCIQRWRTTGMKRLLWSHDTIGVDSSGPV